MNRCKVNCESSGLTNSHTKIINLSNEQVLNEMTQHFVFESVPGYSPIHDDREQIKEPVAAGKSQRNERTVWTMQNKFYFTFGTWKQYPYTRGQYLVVIASDEHDAAMKFKKKYPHPYDEMVLNCAAYYSEKEWNESVSKYYTGEPVEVIGMNIKLRIKVNYDGTKYFTNVNGGYFKEHKSLEDAKNWLDYNGYKNFDTETIVSFSY